MIRPYAIYGLDLYKLIEQFIKKTFSLQLVSRLYPSGLVILQISSNKLT